MATPKPKADSPSNSLLPDPCNIDESAFIASGAVVVANIDPTPSGPAADKSDWCTTSPDGFGQAYYDASGGGNSTVEWCTNWIDLVNGVKAYKVTEFVQW